jgi:RimJ/RimL family protein N-acetyltransferase
VPRRVAAPPLAPPDPPLSDGRIRLEPLAQRDRGDAWLMAQDDDVKRFTYFPADADERWIADWIARYERGWHDRTCTGFSIRAADDDSFVGFAAIVRLDLEAREGEIGYVVSPAARGRGAAAAAVSLLSGWGFDALGLERLELRIDDANRASRRVAERAGYQLDGVLRSVYFKEGRRVDTGVWSRLRSDKLST